MKSVETADTGPFDQREADPEQPIYQRAFVSPFVTLG